jgi:hypothetical protein
MNTESFSVRPVGPDDDFERIERLYYRTRFEPKQAWMNKSRIAYRRDNWKQLLFPNTGAAGPFVLKRLSMSGFIAERDGVICAFATVGLSPASHNGYIDYGCDSDCEFMLPVLFEQCVHTVKQAGGCRLYQTTSMPLGQIRNDEITFLEAHGFRCNSFYHVFVEHRQLADWTPPEELDLASIQAALSEEMNEISAILEEDQEFFLAEEFRGNFMPNTPDHIFLRLTDEQGQIQGIAYYKVWEKSGSLSATAFGLHFRPGRDVSREEMRRLLQASMLSMKQLGVTTVWSRVSSQNFNTILELSAEGFELSPNHTVMMVRTV